MQTKTAFSSKRFLLALMLCACSIILLQNDNIAADTSFTSQLIGIFAGLSVCFLLFLPAVYIKTHFDRDVVSLVSDSLPKLKIPFMTVYACYFVYTALYFLLPYTEMFHTKYFPEVSPCLITVLLLVCCVYAALKGVNVISRFGVFLFVFAMVTNFLMFGGSISELDWAHCTFALSGDIGEFFQKFMRFLVDGILHNRVFIEFRRLNKFRVRVERVELGAAGPAEFVDECISGDINQPGLDRCDGRIEGLVMRHRFHEDFADQILRALPVKNPCINIVVDAGELLLEHYSKIFFIHLIIRFGHLHNEAS